MTSNVLTIYSRQDLSTAWGRAFLHVIKRGVKEIAPLVVSVTNMAPSSTAERQEIRDALDSRILALQTKYPKLQSCHTVANTIFPQSMWNSDMADGAARLFDRYEKAWKKNKALPPKPPWLVLPTLDSVSACRRVRTREPVTAYRQYVPRRQSPPKCATGSDIRPSVRSHEFASTRLSLSSPNCFHPHR